MRPTQVFRRVATFAFLGLIPLVTFCQAQAPQNGPAQKSPQPKSIAGKVSAETVAQGLEHPWGLAFLPDGRMLVTERPGRLRIVGRTASCRRRWPACRGSRPRARAGCSTSRSIPRSPQNRPIYLSFSEPGDGGAGTAVARARLGEGGLEDMQVIYRQQPKVGRRTATSARASSSRRDGTLFVTQGDRSGLPRAGAGPRLRLGKVVRINPDGTIPHDNPFVGKRRARPEIWSYGHRNVQAAALHPDTGELWTVEHGARGGDELNHPQAGKNYGWPVITYGVDYSGAASARARPRRGWSSRSTTGIR